MKLVEIKKLNNGFTNIKCKKCKKGILTKIGIKHGKAQYEHFKDNKTVGGFRGDVVANIIGTEYKCNTCYTKFIDTDNKVI